MWDEFGLGLQDANGALRSDLIELATVTSQSKVDFPVDFSLHRAANDALLSEIPPQSETDPLVRTCFELYGHCKTQPHHSRAAEFARGLASLTSSQMLDAGTVVGLKPVSTSAVTGECYYFFLGVLLKKPLLQVLVEAKRCGSSFRMLEVESQSSTSVEHETGFAAPSFMTSFVAFHDIIEKCNGNVDGFSVLVFCSTFETSLWGLHELCVSTQGPPTEFAIGEGTSFTKQKRTVKPRVDLPFGLKPDVKKRGTRKKNTTTKTMRTEGTASASHNRIVMDESSGSENGNGNVSQPLQPEVEVDFFSIDGSSDSDSAVDQIKAAEVDQLDENIAAPTSSARLEEKSVRAACDEFEADVAVRADLAEAHRAGASFFAKSIGFRGGSIAPTGRSKCYHCEQKIPKDTVRFAFFWSVQRPERYIHIGCVIPFVTQDLAARKEQAVGAFQQMAAQNSANRNIQDGTESILTDLLNL